MNCFTPDDSTVVVAQCDKRLYLGLQYLWTIANARFINTEETDAIVHISVRALTSISATVQYIDALLLYFSERKP